MPLRHVSHDPVRFGQMNDTLLARLAVEHLLRLAKDTPSRRAKSATSVFVSQVRLSCPSHRRMPWRSRGLPVRVRVCGGVAGHGNLRPLAFVPLSLRLRLRSGSSGSPRWVRIFRIGPGSRTGSPQQPEVAKSAKGRDGFALGRQSERNQPDVTTTGETCKRKPLPHPRHQFRPGDP